MRSGKEGDTIGGVITCVASGVPSGLGEPVFDKLHADLRKAMLSINAAKGFEIGSGFHGAGMRGSTHNDILKTVMERSLPAPIIRGAFRWHQQWHGYIFPHCI